MMNNNEWEDQIVGRRITKDEWKGVLNNRNVFATKGLVLLKRLTDNPDGLSCKEMSIRYGGKSKEYLAICNNQNKKVAKSLGISTDGKVWPIMFLTRRNDNGNWVYKIRPELAEAISESPEIFENIDASPVMRSSGTDEESMEDRYRLNTILYGPPGTGKTYNVKRMAVEIVTGKDMTDTDRDTINRMYDEFSDQNLIDFVTFHQSYGYEEFIEGIKPCFDGDDDGKLEYCIEDGAFKRFCNMITNADHAGVQGMNADPQIWKVSLMKTGDNPIREECLRNGHIRLGFNVKDINNLEEYDGDGKIIVKAFVNHMSIGDIVISCYSQKTVDAIGIVTSECRIDDGFDTYRLVRDVKWIRKFDEPFDIFDLNGGKNMTLSAVYRLNNIDRSTIVDMLGSQDESLAPSKKMNRVFIIDEINRGNISRIFGELITLIEPSKRKGGKDQMSVRLPYSKNEFSVPDNVYIIGTMNTADRSLVNLDTALRRRFDFIEMMPEPELLNKDIQGVDLCQLLSTINRRIEVLYDREHTIGHAMLIDVEDMEDLSDAFRRNIIPLLQEYFHNDYSRVLRVLSLSDDSCSSPFIEEVDNDVFTDGYGNVTYRIDWDALYEPSNYISLYRQG